MSELCEIPEVTGVEETLGGALLCRAPSVTVGRFSVPLKLIHETSEVQREGDTGTLVIPQFLAEEKELV